MTLRTWPKCINHSRFPSHIGGGFRSQGPHICRGQRKEFFVPRGARHWHPRTSTSFAPAASPGGTATRVEVRCGTPEWLGAPKMPARPRGALGPVLHLKSCGPKRQLYGSLAMVDTWQRGNGNGTFRLVCFRASCHRPGPSDRLRWASARTWRPRSWPRPGATRSARTSAWRWAAPSRRPEEIRWAWKLRLAVRQVSRRPLGFPGGPKPFVRFHTKLDCLTSQGAFCPNLGSDLRPHGGSKLSFYLLAEATASDPSVMDPTFGFEDLTR